MEITDRNGDPVAKIPCGIKNIDFRYTNTDLFLAAPKLLAACRQVADWLSSFSMPPTSTIAEKQEHLGILEAVIAKAEGRQ